MLCTIGALLLLFLGGVQLVLLSKDTYSVATNVNMVLINGTLPVMAFVVMLMRLKDLVVLIRKPADEFLPEAKEL